MQTSSAIPCKCDNTATPVCGRTRGELDTLLEKARVDGVTRRDTDAYGDYFKSLPCSTNGDVMEHCKECSKTIAKHQQSAPPSLPPPLLPDNIMRIFGAVNPPSDKVTSRGSDVPKEDQALAHRLKFKFKTCAVCGFHVGSTAKEYPGATARNHAVSTAHILASKNDCAVVGVPWDESNFIPLCGAKDEVPSCHSAFDRKLVCFVRDDDDATRWMAHSSDETYKHLNRTIVRFETKPHRRALHAHALYCYHTKQVDGVFTNLNTTPPDNPDDPAPAVVWDEVSTIRKSTSQEDSQSPPQRTLLRNAGPKPLPHVEPESKGKVSRKGPKTFDCTRCDLKYMNQRALDGHMQLAHPPKCALDLGDDDDEPAETRVKGRE